LPHGTAALPGCARAPTKRPRYDQKPHLPTLPENFTNAGGVLDFFLDELFPGKEFTREKFSFHFPDHLSLSLQMRTDNDGYRLGQIAQDGRN